MRLNEPIPDLRVRSGAAMITFAPSYLTPSDLAKISEISAVTSEFPNLIGDGPAAASFRTAKETFIIS